MESENNIFDREAINEFYSSVLKPILPNASHKSLRYIGSPTTRANSIGLDLADSNRINSQSQYYYKKSYKFIHYTSLQNAINIIRSKKIRLYNLEGMDDQEEFVASTKYLNTNLSEYKIKEIKKNIFCFSMCEEDVEKKGKSISMWREYAQDGNGLGIVFSFNKILASDWVNYMLSKVYYGEKSLEIFKKVSQLYQDFKIKHNITINTFDELFYKYYSFHKNKIYINEKEVRFLYNSGFKEYNKPIAKYDLNRRGRQTTYIELPLEWKWDIKTKQFIESQNVVPKNVNPIIKVEKIVFGYRLSNDQKRDIFETISKLVTDYDQKPKFEDSVLMPYFNGNI